MDGQKDDSRDMKKTPAISLINDRPLSHSQDGTLYMSKTLNLHSRKFHHPSKIRAPIPRGPGQLCDSFCVDLLSARSNERWAAYKRICHAASKCVVRLHALCRARTTGHQRKSAHILCGLKSRACLAVCCVDFQPTPTRATSTTGLQPRGSLQNSKALRKPLPTMPSPT